MRAASTSDPSPASASPRSDPRLTRSTNVNSVKAGSAIPQLSSGSVWKTPKSYAGCRVMGVDLADGSEHLAPSTSIRPERAIKWA